MPITGIQAGGNANFTVGFVPPNGVPLQSGPTVTSADTLVTIGAATVDPSDVRFNFAVDASDTESSFMVTVVGVNGAGTEISADFVIPISTAPPPQITDFTLDQDESAPPLTAKPKTKR